jgi:ATP-dependent DNA helicase RecG
LFHEILLYTLGNANCQPHENVSLMTIGMNRSRNGDNQVDAATEQAIDGLFAPLDSLRGAGPALARQLARVTGGREVVDLLWHLPESVTDRRWRPTIRELQPGRIATLSGIISRVTPPAHARQPWRAVIDDGTGECSLTFFAKWQARSLKPGASIVISGRTEEFAGRPVITNPDYLLPGNDLSAIPTLDSVWPLTAGLFTNQIRRMIRQAITLIPDNLPEWYPEQVIAQTQWPDFRKALLWLHFPGDFPHVEDWEKQRSLARTRLAADEIMADQIALQRARAALRALPGRLIHGNGEMCAEALRRFGHEPTEAQSRVIAEINHDIGSGHRMTRLLQGDVGSGKTLVALMAMLKVAESGAQAAIMAPTEILARQHFATFTRLSPVPVAFLSGSVRGKARKETLAAIADGSAKLIIGTHALVQENVVFHDLALAIVDEQHRFGVAQRLELTAKGMSPHMLVMTATPIPRTLLLTRWGQLQVSRLDTRPAGRKPVKTSLHNLETLDKITEAIARAIARGGRVFWVCPLVAESEELDVAAAEERHKALQERFGALVGLAHGQQDVAEREENLESFVKGDTRILVATTVIEVGVDVPSATVMIIEHAERFGLAQLHQLRGRVGRGSEASFCLLLHENNLSATARSRLKLLRDSDDGFRIADEDFRNRGAGDLTGKRQAGEPGFRIASYADMDHLLPQIRKIIDFLQHSKTRENYGNIVHPLLRFFGKEKSETAFEAS